MSPTPPEGTGHDRATTAPRKPKLILMTAPVSCPPRGNRRVARSGAEWRGDLLFPQGWGVVQKMYFVWAEAPEFCRPFPLVGGGSFKKVYLGVGWRRILSPPTSRGGGRPSSVFLGVAPDIPPPTPPASGGVVQTSVLGGRVRRVLIAPTPRGNKRSPRHSAPSLTKNALASAPLRARSPCHSAPPVTKNALDSAPLRATPRHPLFPLGATKTGAPPPPNTLV